MKRLAIWLKVFACGLLGGANVAMACTPTYQVLRESCEANCPVANVIEIAGCYQRPVIDVSEDFVRSCVEAPHTDIEAIFIRTRCLIDSQKIPNLTSRTLASVRDALGTVAKEAHALPDNANAQRLALMIEH